MSNKPPDYPCGKPIESGTMPEVLAGIVDSSPDAILIVDTQGNIVFANSRCESLLGFTAVELIGQCIEVLVPAQHSQHQALRSAYQQQPVTKTMGHRPVLDAQHKSGAMVPVDISLSPLPMISGHDRLVQAVVRDAMPHRNSRQELVLQAVAMNAAANGIVITNGKGIIEWVNPAVSKITGYASAELIGQHTRLLKSGLHDDGFYAELWATITAGKTWFGEITNKRKDGAIYHEEQHIAPVQGEDGSVRHFIAIKQDITARKVAEDKLQEVNQKLKQRLQEVESLQQQLKDQALRDPLTNLYNRRYLDEALDRELERGRRDGVALSVVMLDIDKFKALNDNAGHAAGDAVIQNLAQLLTNNTRQSDIACRWGGDEFLVVLCGADLDTAKERSELLREGFCHFPNTKHTGKQYPSCTLTLGVARFRPESDNAESLLKRADDALYQAKRQGGNRVIVVS